MDLAQVAWGIAEALSVPRGERADGDGEASCADDAVQAGQRSRDVERAREDPGAPVRPGLAEGSLTAEMVHRIREA